MRYRSKVNRGWGYRVDLIWYLNYCALSSLGVYSRIANAHCYPVVKIFVVKAKPSCLKMLGKNPYQEQ